MCVCHLEGYIEEDLYKDPTPYPCGAPEEI